MSLQEMLPGIQALPRTDKFQLMKILLEDLARVDSVPFLEAGKSYPVWTPFGAVEAAAALMKLLEEEKAAHDS
jgi:hypothetical protein